MLLIVMVVFWIFAGACCFRVSRVDLEDANNSVAADFICSFLFWWLVLPFFAAVTEIKLGQHYGNQMIVRLKIRGNQPQLRAGAENGLYE